MKYTCLIAFLSVGDGHFPWYEFSVFDDGVQIFIQTGYPLDLPSGSLGSYCIYEYHMVCFTISFFVSNFLSKERGGK